MLNWFEKKTELDVTASKFKSRFNLNGANYGLNLNTARQIDDKTSLYVINNLLELLISVGKNGKLSNVTLMSMRDESEESVYLWFYVIGCVAVAASTTLELKDIGKLVFEKLRLNNIKDSLDLIQLNSSTIQNSIKYSFKCSYKCRLGMWFSVTSAKNKQDAFLQAEELGNIEFAQFEKEYRN